MGRINNNGHSHRASGLKQSNKKFKSKHSSKGSLKDKNKGKVNRRVVHGKKDGTLNKNDRKNSSKVGMKFKNQQLKTNTKVFEGKFGAPKIVALVPLCPDVSVLNLAEKLAQSVNQPFEVQGNKITLSAPQLKQRLQLVLLTRDIYDIMDACKVADYVVFLLSAQVEVDAIGETTISCIQSQGAPTSFNFVQHLDREPLKRRPDIKKSLSSFVNFFFPEQDKILEMDNNMECLTTLRSMVSQVPKAMPWREGHPYILSDKVEFVANPNQSGTGTLKVTGFLRGNNMNANRLVHIPNFGDYQIDRIEKADHPFARQHNNMGDEMTDSDNMKLLAVPDAELQETLISSNEPDMMEGEQTWPTQEELLEAENALKNNDNGSKKVKVPKGTSSYQAAWIVDDEDGEEDYEDDMDVDEEEEDEVYEHDGPEEYEEIDMNDDNKSVAPFDALDEEEEMRQFEEYKRQREAERTEHLEFPDEVDTPLNVPARVRFQKYRGMLSMRTSPWDPYENLPQDYSRIFQFQNFARTKKRVLTQANDGTVEEGAYVTLYIKDVDNTNGHLYHPERPFIVFGLLPHENKVTLLNFAINKYTEYTEPVRSKEPLILQFGFRRFRIQPIFSEHHHKGKTNNVYKFQRYFENHSSAVMSLYGPVTFTTAPVVVFKENPDNLTHPSVVAMGSFLDHDTTRIVAKRIIITGHPFKVHKKSAVVRYMFFSPEDIDWFKPIQLHTKHGKIGHIKESLGTHGYMKCLFNDLPKQHDTVCMSLYKRVFPKWNTEMFVRPNYDYIPDEMPSQKEGHGMDFD
jgi:pre-rRNA-processing protein TSR1